MDAYVVKVQFEDSLRRLSLEGAEQAFSYAHLVSRIRELFPNLAAAQLTLTYADRDGDVVTLADDQDLRDALVLQALNPLRLQVTVVSGETAATDPGHQLVEQRVENGTDGKNENGRQKEKSDAEPAPTSTPDAKIKRIVDAGVPALHRGVVCDDCGMKPIAGPRFKSITKDNYDLCRTCFEKPEVDASDYIKITRGKFAPRSLHFGRVLEHGAQDERLCHHRRGLGKKDGVRENGRREENHGGRMKRFRVECDERKTGPLLGPRFKTRGRLGLFSDKFPRIDRPVRRERPSHHSSLFLSMPGYFPLAASDFSYRFAPYPLGGRPLRRIAITSVGLEE